MVFFASVNGLVTPAEQARLSPLDTGFTFGDSVYETLRTYAGRPFHLDRHVERLGRSAARTGIELTLSRTDWAERVEQILTVAANDESYIRLVVSRGVGDVSYRFDRISGGPTIVVLVKPFESFPDALYTEGMGAALVSVRRNPTEALDPAIKSGNLLNNVLAVREAQARGAVEAILLNTRGEVAEGASSNVFIVSNGVLRTPPLAAGILEGITRGLVLDLAQELGIAAREETLWPDELAQADEMFVTSSLKEVAPVCRLDERPVGPGRPGPITTRLLTAYRDHAARFGAAG